MNGVDFLNALRKSLTFWLIPLSFHPSLKLIFHLFYGSQIGVDHLFGMYAFVVFSVEVSEEEGEAGDEEEEHG